MGGERKTSLWGARVLITGGGHGLGRCLAREAAERGARVTIWDVSAPRAQAVCDEVRAEGGAADFHRVDVSDRTAVQAAAAATGPVDVLVNNAGVVSGQALLDADEESIERTIQVNVLGLYWVTRAFLGGMVARGCGTVVTVASAAGLVGVAGQCDYAASKAAAIRFDESLRAEMRTQHTGVRTLVACPAYIDTGMFDGAQPRFRWLLPVLDARTVVVAILDAVESGRRRLVLPRLAQLVPWLRILPVPLFDRLVDALGVNGPRGRGSGR